MHPLSNLENFQIILASKSPRRKQLLEMLCINFSIDCANQCDESYPQELNAFDIPIYISEKKARHYLYLEHKTKAHSIIITADTMVISNGKPLGKPKSRDEACEMLRELSDNQHYVVTGVTLMSMNKNISFSETTKVRFTKLTEEEINYYVDNFKPYDKAGSYGIQEWIGCIGIDSIEGDFYNVMGLPVCRIYHALKQFKAKK